MTVRELLAVYDGTGCDATIVDMHTLCESDLDKEVAAFAPEGDDMGVNISITTQEAIDASWARYNSRK